MAFLWKILEHEPVKKHKNTYGFTGVAVGGYKFPGDVCKMCQIASGQLDKNKETVSGSKIQPKRIYIHRRLKFQTSSRWPNYSNAQYAWTLDFFSYIAKCNARHCNMHCSVKSTQVSIICSKYIIQLQM